MAPKGICPRLAKLNEKLSKFDDIKRKLNKLRLSNANNVIVSHLNINSLPGKFDQLKRLITNKIYILVLTETKLDETFPPFRFLIDGFSKPIRLDRNRNGGGILIFVRNDFPSKLLTKHHFPDDIEGLFIELNFRKTKCLFLGMYHPPSQNDQYYFDCRDKALDIYNNYDKVILTGGFNSEEVETVFETFLYQHDLKSLAEGGSCFKNPERTNSINLFLTNKPLSFHHTLSVFTGLSDFHKMGSRRISPEENCPLNPNPNPNRNRGQFYLGAILLGGNCPNTVPLIIFNKQTLSFHHTT